MRSADQIAERLRELVPLLKHGRKTHRLWRDYLRHPSVPDSAAKDVGNANYHQLMVEEYDERIAAVTEAANFLSRNTKREK